MGLQYPDTDNRGNKAPTTNRKKIMQAIHTKYIGPTTTKGSRIKAYTNSGFTATIGYPYELSGAAVHYEAVKALALKHGLDRPIDAMVVGDSADNKGYTFVFTTSTI